MSERIINLLLIALSVGVASAFCSLAESSIVGLSEVGIKQQRKKKPKNVDLLMKLLENRSKYMSSIIMLNTLINVGGSMAVGSIAASTLPAEGGSGVITYGTFVLSMTIGMLLFSEIKPKIYAAQYSERVAVLVYYPLAAITWFLTPVVNAINGFLNNKDNEKSGMSIVDIEYLIGAASESGTLKKAETDLVINVLKLRAKTASEISKENCVISMSISDKIEDHADEIMASEHKKIVITNHLNFPVGVATKEDALISLIKRDRKTFADIMHFLPVISHDSTLSCVAKKIHEAPVKLLGVIGDDHKIVGVIGMSDIKEILFTT
ncbi:MAG: CNNM domain-containing protein [Flavobacteriaceae bacterium]